MTGSLHVETTGHCETHGKSDLGCHLFDITKTHADVEPVQDTSRRRLNRRLRDAFQSVSAIGENNHLGFGRPAGPRAQLS